MCQTIVDECHLGTYNAFAFIDLGDVTEVGYGYKIAAGFVLTYEAI
jgi:hypothetical protein